MPPLLRTDVVDVYVARRGTLGLEFLQLRRREPPLAGTWQPIMGHTHDGERAEACMWRELREEAGLRASDGAFRGAWALEQVHPFFIRELDAVLLSPRFVVEVSREWRPVLDDEHDAVRWVQEAKVEEMFLWPGQQASVREACSVLRGSPASEHLRVPVP